MPIRHCVDGLRMTRFGGHLILAEGPEEGVPGSAWWGWSAAGLRQGAKP
jgi:hypothetical protein